MAKKPPKNVNKLITDHAKPKPEKGAKPHKQKSAPTHVLTLIAQVLSRKKGK